MSATSNAAVEANEDDVNPMAVGANALIYAADCIEKITEKEHMGAHYTWRRGFNAAHSHNVESATGSDGTFDAAEDVYSEVIADVTINGDGLGGLEAADVIRKRANNLLKVA